MKRFLIPTSILLVVGVLGGGCGGSGASSTGSTGSNPTQTTVSLTADHPTITLGQAVNLTWFSQNASSVTTSNIGATTVNGTLAVSPTFSSDYTITVFGQNSVTSSVHITVTRPTPRFIIVGSSAHPDIPQIQALLQKVGTVTVQSTMPASTSSYDAVVIHGSGSISPVDQPTITAALAANKGVVLLGLAPSEISNGLGAYTTTNSPTDSKLDTTAIAAWFGGVTELDRSTNGAAPSSVANLSFFALPKNADLSTRITSIGGGDDPQLGNAPSGLVGVTCYSSIFTQGENPAMTFGFAFRPPTGGRLYFQWHYQGFDSTHEPEVAGIFTNASLWAASP